MKRPTQLEMMAYLDGEQSLLGEERAREVSDWFASDEGQSYKASRKRNAALLGALLRDQAPAPPINFADDIMAAIAREPRVEAPRESRPVPALRVIPGGLGREIAAEAGPVSSHTQRAAVAREQAAGSEPRVEEAPAARVSGKSATRSPRPAALGLLLAVVAAAAALLVWWRSPAAPTVRYEAGVGLQPSAQGAAGSETADPAPSGMLAIATTLDDDDIVGDDGSEIDSVDFGTQSGAIFYVPGKAHTNSAVIWVDDEEAPP